MTEKNRNILIGKGEKLLSDGVWKSSNRDKGVPYSIDQQRGLFHPALEKLAALAANARAFEAPRGEVCAKLTVHPEYLAKSYFPLTLLRQSSLRLLGSRGAVVQPRAMVKNKPPKPGPTAVLIVAGTLDSYNLADKMLMSDERVDLPRHREFCKLEAIELFGELDRQRVDFTKFDGWLEVAVHAALQDQDIRESFVRLVKAVGGTIELARMRTVGGLSFAPVYLPKDHAVDAVGRLSRFSHLRILRNMPLISVDPDLGGGLTRQLALSVPKLPDGGPVDPSLRTAIFDGGFTPGLLPWVRSFDATGGVAASAKDISHGEHVTSAFLFGPTDEMDPQLPRPYSNVDHIQVLPSQANDYRVLDVIDRIINTLKDARDRGVPYELANLSLGPRLPILNEDPHEWTVRLDDFLSLGDLFLTVAVGNDGVEGPDLGRIQPPSDAVNCFAVGAADRPEDNWQRADYSCLGPGRSPGLVKPDAVVHGGSRVHPLQLYSPKQKSLTPKAGTSYSAPMALRLAAGLRASIEQRITPIMLHALLVSGTTSNPRRHDQTSVGWGLLPASAEQLMYSAADEVVVMYQGEIESGKPLRARIPLPPNLHPDSEVQIRATFAYRAPTDPAHPVNYTKAGLWVRFQPDGLVSQTFFSITDYDTEEVLRRDGLRWDTCIDRKKKYSAGVLSDPSFTINYQTREEGHSATKAAPKRSSKKKKVDEVVPIEEAKVTLPFALVLRLKVVGVADLASRVLVEHKVLEEVSLRAGIQVQGN